MINLLEETKMCLESNGKDLSDILWIGNNDIYTEDNFESVLNVEYDSGYGGVEIAHDLVVVGDGFWLERGEYDGSEWWEFESNIERPRDKVSRLIVKDDEGLWRDLSELNIK